VPLVDNYPVESCRNSLPYIAFATLVFPFPALGLRKKIAMSLEFLEAAKLNLSDSLVSRVALSLSETEPNIRKAFKAAIPAILAGILHKTGRIGDESGIMDMLRNVSATNALNDLQDLLDAKRNYPYPTAAVPAYGIHSMIPDWQKTIFGAKLINIVNALSIFSEIKSSSASTVLNIATPVTLTPIAQYAAENSQPLRDLESMLRSQAPAIFKAIPPGFNLIGSLGVDKLEDIGTQKVVMIPEPVEHRKNKSRPVIGKWVWPLMLLATFGGLIWFFSRKNEPQAATSGEIRDTLTQLSALPLNTRMVGSVAGRMDSLTGDFIYDAGAETQLKLPDSTILTVGVNSTEAKLFRMLSDTSFIIDTIDKTKNWITFDRVYFESDEAVLKSDPYNQIKNIAIILKNFPSSSIKIGGYTDNTGDTVQNNVLSEARAKIVMQQIVNMGLDPNKITEAIGYGPDHPVCPSNDTPECKARNRRVDLKLATK